MILVGLPNLQLYNHSWKFTFISFCFSLLFWDTIPLCSKIALELAMCPKLASSILLFSCCDFLYAGITGCVYHYAELFWFILPRKRGFILPRSIYVYITSLTSLTCLLHSWHFQLDFYFYDKYKTGFAGFLSRSSKF